MPEFNTGKRQNINSLEDQGSRNKQVKQDLVGLCALQINKFFKTCQLLYLNPDHIFLNLT